MARLISNNSSGEQKNEQRSVLCCSPVRIVLRAQAGGRTSEQHPIGVFACSLARREGFEPAVVR